MFVYQLNRSIVAFGETYPTGNLSGVLYQSLDSAMRAVGGVEWLKREHQQVWESDNLDLIARVKVLP